MHLDGLLEDIGSFGKFQIILIPLVLLPEMLTGYNMMIMAYGSLVPDWWCIQQDQSIFNISTNNTTIYKQCSYSSDNSSKCHRVYDDSFTTVVSEFDLVCERQWIPSVIISIQMGGVLIGAVITGQCADLFGRKKTFYLSLLLQSIFSISIVFVQSWYMFCFVRFLVGAAIGGFLSVCLFLSEFIGCRYRPVLSLIPWWSTGVCFLSLTSWLLQSWVYIHLVIGFCILPFILGWFFVPESVRWLTVKGRLTEAEVIVEKIARMNGRRKPAYTTAILTKLAEEERQSQRGKQYTYLDLYKGCKMAKHTITINTIWICLSASYYGFGFGVGKLSGNYYLNQFYMNILGYPIFIPVILAMNRFGRRVMAVFMFSLGTICCVGIVIVQFTVGDYLQGAIITALSLLTRLFVGQAWAVIEVLTNESYPTVIRNLGFGAANTSARIGGIVAPFLFTLSDNTTVPYVAVIFLLGLSSVLSFCCLPETLNRALEDMLPVRQKTIGNKDGDEEVEMASYLQKQELL